jgi:predicted nicotinamide N-methyase
MNLPFKATTLHQELSQKWPLKAEKLQLGTESFQVFVVAEVEQLLDEFLEKDENSAEVKDERIPYWADLWASALGLARHIMAQPQRLAGKRVLEIGCGLGLPGIVAARAGAQVTLTDYLPDALRLARLNCYANLPGEPDLQLLDWRQPPAELKVDILLASDVAYEKRAFEPLIKAFPSLLRPGGSLWLSEPSRAWAQAFIRELSTQFTLQNQAQYLIQQEGLESKVQVLEIGR